MATHRALILAAGRGSRLGGASRDVPKCMLEIGRRRLIEHQIDSLADAGIGPVVMVLGYCAEEVREVVGIRAEYVHNPRWESTNSLYSFALAEEAIDGPVVILNSDVLFAPSILERLLDVEGDAIAIDSSSGDAREQMKVQVEAGRVVRMAKDLPVELAAGENLGILKLTEETTRALFAHARSLLEQGHEKDWLGVAFAEIASRRPIQAVDVAGLPWIEIDFPSDLVAARKDVWPRIAASRRRLSRGWRRAGWIAAAAALVLAGVWPLMSSSPSPAAAEWETLAVSELSPVQITVSGRQQNWWQMDSRTPLTIHARGPGELRVETRLLNVEAEDENYVIEIWLDEGPPEWRALRTWPSKKATHPGWLVGHKKRVKLDLDDGDHVLRVRMVAPCGAHCLVRARQAQSEEED